MAIKFKTRFARKTYKLFIEMLTSVQPFSLYLFREDIILLFDIFNSDLSQSDVVLNIPSI